jgi:RNA polymerase sigma-70 factor, ECF subfamily
VSRPLLNAFLSAAPVGVRRRLEGRHDGLEEALAELVESASQAWPTLAGEGSELARHAGSGFYCSDQEDPQAAIRGLHAGDLLLALRCHQREPHALAAVERRLAGDRDRLLRQLNATESFLDELLQALRIRLIVGEGPAGPRIGAYSGRGPLGRWLRAAAFHAAQNLRRKQGQEEAPRPEASGLPDELVEPELQWARERYRRDFDLAFVEALSTLTARERNVLRLYFVEGLTVEKIGRAYSQNRSTISRQLTATRERLGAQTRAALTRRLGVPPAELESLVRLLASDLDCNLADCLSPPTS